jgi:hypothetical protein
MIQCTGEEIKMDILNLQNFEAQFGLMIREKENANNYALIRFEDLDKIIEFYNSLKEEFSKKGVDIT